VGWLREGECQWVFVRRRWFWESTRARERRKERKSMGVMRSLLKAFSFGASGEGGERIAGTGERAGEAIVCVWFLTSEVQR